MSKMIYILTISSLSNIIVVESLLFLVYLEAPIAKLPKSFDNFYHVLKNILMESK